MDFERNADQRAIVEAVEALLAQYAGPARAIELDAKGEYDHALDAALVEAGFSGDDLARQTGPLEAALVVESVARAGGVVAATWIPMRPGAPIRWQLRCRGIPPRPRSPRAPWVP